MQTEAGLWISLSVTPQEVEALHSLPERVAGSVISRVAGPGATTAALVATTWGLEVVRVSQHATLRHWRVSAGKASGHLTPEGSVLCVSGRSALEIHGLTRGDVSVPPFHLSHMLLYGDGSKTVRFCWGFEDAPLRSQPAEIPSVRHWGGQICILSDTPDAKAVVLVIHASTSFGAFDILWSIRRPSQDVHIFCAAVSRESAPQVEAIFVSPAESLESLAAGTESALETHLSHGSELWRRTEGVPAEAVEAGAAGTCWLVATLRAPMLPEDALVVLVDAVTTEKTYLRIMASAGV